MAFVAQRTGINAYSGYVYDDPETGQARPIYLVKETGRPKKRHSRKVWHDQDKKVETATLIAVTGDIKHASELAKVTVNQIRKWMKEPWWNAVISRVRSEHNELLDAKLTDIIGQAADKISERIKDGDEVLFKGKPIKKQISARDLATITNVLFDKRQLLRGEATSRTESKSQSDQLAELKQKFEAWAKIKVVNDDVDITDVEIINAETIPSDQTEFDEARQIEESRGVGSGSDLQLEAQKESSN